MAPVPLIPSERLSGTEPVLFKITAWAVLTPPAAMLGNVIEGTDTDRFVPASRPIVPSEAAAVPVSDTEDGLPAALLATFNAAEKVPTDAELKATVMVQCAPTARVVPQVVPVTVKSLLLVPLIEVAPTFTFAFPVFVSVAVSGSLNVATVL